MEENTKGREREKNIGNTGCNKRSNRKLKGSRIWKSTIKNRHRKNFDIRGEEEQSRRGRTEKRTREKKTGTKLPRRKRTTKEAEAGRSAER